ncbi:DoxX family protein [Halosquirtibacter laminarini]|uniref:DoxX family protein n=1 Tax=Halosquirtibacter laminarini TaxID=3374600 RepID=A0AC61NP16_9BACT|nr:DoxX family protein [Prolixibacteraceae bacterium]
MIKSILFSSKVTGTSLALLVLRVALGLLMITHGWGKFEAYDTLIAKEQFPAIVISVKVSVILAIFAELVCAALVVIGAFTRLATIPLIITMLVAVLLIHAGDPIGQKELAILYLVGFIALFIMGPGKFSIDQLVKK